MFSSSSSSLLLCLELQRILLPLGILACLMVAVSLACRSLPLQMRNWCSGRMLNREWIFSFRFSIELSGDSCNSQLVPACFICTWRKKYLIEISLYCQALDPQKPRSYPNKSFSVQIVKLSPKSRMIR